MPKVIQPEDRSTIQEIIACLMDDFNLPDNDEGKAIALLVAHDIDRGYSEAEPLRQKYSALICKWCGRAHFSKEHQEANKRYFEEVD